MKEFNYLKIQLILIMMLLVLFFPKYIFADTAIPDGSVSGIWDFAGSPYIVEGAIQIDSGESLTIEAGVVVKFGADTGLTSAGTLTAIGTEELPILFTSEQTSPSPGYWTGLEFSAGSSGSELYYIEVEYAVDGITCDESSPDIIDCTFQYNSNDGIVVKAYASGCSGGTAAPTISGCTISNNLRYGIRYSGTADSSLGCISPRTGRAGGEI